MDGYFNIAHKKQLKFVIFYLNNVSCRFSIFYSLNFTMNSTTKNSYRVAGKVAVDQQVIARIPFHLPVR